MGLEMDTARIMADHGIIPAETLKPIEATRATEQQDHRSFPEAADGRPMPPMVDELMTAGLNCEDARFVAIQLAQNGLTLAPAEQGGAEAERLRAQLSEMSAQYTRACQIVDKTCAERDALKAEVEELRMSLQAEIMFSDFVAAKFRVNPDKLCLTVHVRPDGQEVATDRKPDGSEAASITWAEVHAGSRIALRAEQKGFA